VIDNSAGPFEDLVEEFSDGKIQYAFARIQDQNSKLPKYILIGWVEARNLYSR
jgi:hypothetical protein